MNPPTKIPIRLGPVHFIGIGGIGMSGIAEVLLNHGYQVQGSDLSSTQITSRLERLGARIFEGHHSGHLAGADVAVVSSAIREGNPELQEARRLGMPIVRRAEMLAELMRLKSNVAVAGTHGKTTTTTMVATLLEQGGFDPTVVNGGIIRAYESNARPGSGEWMVVEADESDGTFIKLPATVAVVTNIDPEHLDHYGNFENLKAAFASFVANVPFYGFAVCCTDHPEVQNLAGRTTDRRIISYGFNAQADVGGVNLRPNRLGVKFDVLFRQEDVLLEDCSLPMPGEHNVLNALAAIAVARGLGIDLPTIRSGLAAFSGVGRRFTRTGESGGVAVVDDYAHHPVEIAAAIKAARQATEGRVIAVHQPHRYSRLASLFDGFCACFKEADVVGICDVYPAGENPVPGIDRDALVDGLRQFGQRQAFAFSGADGLAELVMRQSQPGDLVICMGAGSISGWAHELPAMLSGKSEQGGTGE